MGPFNSSCYELNEPLTLVLMGHLLFMRHQIPLSFMIQTYEA